MTRISKAFRELESRKEAALTAYVTAGDPKPAYTKKIVEAMVDGGADIIELGLPFSDPIADGPTIQAAVLRSLEAKTTPKTVLKLCSEIRAAHEDLPLVVLTYCNPLFKLGYENFFDKASIAGLDGVIVADLPIEEAAGYKRVASKYKIDTVFLATPATPEDRLRKILDLCSGFLYLVSIFGVTGARSSLQDTTIKTLKKFLPLTSGRIPLAAGFGISQPSHVRTLVRHGAQGVIVGSAFVKIIEENQRSIAATVRKLRSFTRSLKRATRS